MISTGGGQEERTNKKNGTNEAPRTQRSEKHDSFLDATRNLWRLQPRSTSKLLVDQSGASADPTQRASRVRGLGPGHLQLDQETPIPSSYLCILY